jgi:hypothetical protein
MSCRIASIALERKNCGRIKDDINAIGAKTQTKEPFSSLKGADCNFPSSTNWWVNPENEIEPDLPRNGSTPLNPLTGTPESELSLPENSNLASGLDLAAHTIAPLFKLGTKDFLNTLFKPIIKCAGT